MMEVSSPPEYARTTLNDMAISSRGIAVERPDHGDLDTCAAPGASGAVPFDLFRELGDGSRREPELLEELELDRQREHAPDAQPHGLIDHGFDQVPADAAALAALGHGHPDDFREHGRVDPQPRTAHDPRRIDGHEEVVDGTEHILRLAGQEQALRGEAVEDRHHFRHVRRLGGADQDDRSVLGRRIRIRSGAIAERQDEPVPRGHGRRRCRERNPRGGHHASTSSRMPRPAFSSASSMVSGGRSRMTRSPAVPNNSPASKARATNGAAGSASSRPHMSPRPRASTATPRSTRERSVRLTISPLRRTSARNSGAETRRTTSSATARTSGPPPKVVPWSPGRIAEATASVISTAPIGSPPASGLASVRMSGTTPVAS